MTSWWHARRGLLALKYLKDKTPQYHVLQSSGQIIPIEVKAEQNLRAKSLAEFIKRYAPSVVIRTSMAPYERGEKVVDLPLFAISLLPELIRE